MNTTGREESAILGGGCFWCLEAVFEQLKGVHSVESGYAGGDVTNPNYELVCTGTTGHAEVVKVRYNADEIAFGDLLGVFFSIHDPTTLNRQGADSGTQYRSAIFYESPEQKRVAEQTIAELEAKKLWNDPIVTEVTTLEKFYPAEDYHREYFQRNGTQPYCQAIIAPKVAKFRKEHLSRLRQA